MAIKKCGVWQLRVCIIYCIFTALHGVGGMIGLCALQSPMAYPLCENYTRRGSMSSDIILEFYTEK